jgi:pyridoxal phosphate-dependent aminotransferase EpsN
VNEAFTSNWIAPVGPHIDAFENEFAQAVGVSHAAALSSGTAALHLALLLLNVRPGDVVVCPTLTFAASAFAIAYLGADPVFVDSDLSSWNMDPNLLDEAMASLVTRGSAPKAVIVVDLYGQSADWQPIREICARYEVPIVEDSAEALGAIYQGHPVGGFGEFGVFSFNGNKIITTSGGGMLVAENGPAIERAKKLASQAREAASHYEHEEIGFNYRMSNVLAAIGRGQLGKLPDRVASRRQIFNWYEDLLGETPGLRFMPEAEYGRSTRWLTCVTIDPEQFGASREDIRLALEEDDIESRPVWKPLHLQPVFRGRKVFGGSVSEKLFEHGLCLPSGSRLDFTDVERIATVMRRCHVGA